MRIFLKYYYELAFAYIFFIMFATFFHRSVLELFEFFRELSSYDYRVIGSEMLFHIGEGTENSVNRFIDYHGIILILKRLKEGFASFLYGEKSEEAEVVHMHSGTNQS